MRTDPGRGGNVASSITRGRLMLWHGHEVERARDVWLQVAAMHDRIEHAVLEQELAALEAFGQLSAESSAR